MVNKCAYSEVEILSKEENPELQGVTSVSVRLGVCISSTTCGSQNWICTELLKGCVCWLKEKHK